MGKVRSLLCLGALLWASQSAGEARLDLVRLFATCSGAYMAELEHAWLVGDPRAQDLERERAHMNAILDALVPAARSVQATSYRVEARAAHRALLADAHFSFDSARAHRAAQRATEQLGFCRGLLLDS